MPKVLSVSADEDRIGVFAQRQIAEGEEVMRHGWPEHTGLCEGLVKVPLSELAKLSLDAPRILWNLERRFFRDAEYQVVPLDGGTKLTFQQFCNGSDQANIRCESVPAGDGGGDVQRYVSTRPIGEGEELLLEEGEVSCSKPGRHARVLEAADVDVVLKWLPQNSFLDFGGVMTSLNRIKSMGHRDFAWLSFDKAVADEIRNRWAYEAEEMRVPAFGLNRLTYMQYSNHGDEPNNEGGSMGRCTKQIEEGTELLESYEEMPDYFSVQVRNGDAPWKICWTHYCGKTKISDTYIFENVIHTNGVSYKVFGEVGLEMQIYGFKNENIELQDKLRDEEQEKIEQQLKDDNKRIEDAERTLYKKFGDQITEIFKTIAL
eukprot:gene17105-20332_t